VPSQVEADAAECGALGARVISAFNVEQTMKIR
jgi:hypothetical protein